MPERPKRRKNNKNKRKNKNNRSDICKNNDDINNSDIGETCSNQNNNQGIPVNPAESNNNICESKDVEQNVVATSQNNGNIPIIVSADTLFGSLADALVVDNSISERAAAQENVIELLKDNENIPTIINPDTLVGDLNNNNNQNTHTVLPGSSTKNNDIDVVDSVDYFVEPPDQLIHTSKTKLKNVKSKSLDNEDATNIVEITEDENEIENESSLALIDSQNVLITHVDSDVEWEVADDLKDMSRVQETATGTLSITTLPLAILQSDHKSLTPEEEQSLRSYLKTINLVTQPDSLKSIEINTEIQEIVNQEIKQRLRKRGSADDFFLHRIGPPRILDVIDEEGSSESSMTSRRQSYLSDRKSDIEDMDDDVFEDKNKTIKQKTVISNNVTRKKNFGKLVPQECVLVGAKIKDPEVEARGEWTVKTYEKMAGAEVVYLTDTSSSSSSLHEIGEDDDGVDTDVSVRMITPTIEVTDTENFFKKPFMRTTSDKIENTLCKDLHPNSNKFSNKCDENHKHVDSHKNEHIIKVEYEDDKIKMEATDGTKTILNENNKEDHDNYNIDHTENKAESNIKHDLNCPKPNERIINIKIENENDVRRNKSNTIDKIGGNLINNTKPNERIINIEIETDVMKNETNVENFGSQNDHEIVVLSTDDIQTNLYVKDIDETKVVTESILKTTEKFNELSTKILKMDIAKNIHGERKALEHEVKSIETGEDSTIIPNIAIKLQNINKTENVPQNCQESHKQKLLSDSKQTETKDSKYILEAKLIKCEFNDAINNLINEVSIEHEGSNEYPKDTFTRQDSSSSLGSSQCTAKYNPNSESLNDISNIVQDEIGLSSKSNIEESPSITSHIKDVIDCVTESSFQTKDEISYTNKEQPLGLKDLCVLKITTLPYGDQILEELASVSKRLHDFTTLASDPALSKSQDQANPYHSLPDTTNDNKNSRPGKSKYVIPPPIKPRNSSLKKSQDEDQRAGTSKKTEAYVCLSPSQKMLMNKTNTVISKGHPSDHVDKQSTAVDRCEYKECYKSQKQTKDNYISSSTVLPFKSQTGSRLLALIRDPTLTRNINSLNDRINNTPAKQNSTITTENNQEHLSTNRNFLFKPIPPPRPKKYSTSFYESDESSDFADNSFRSMKKDRKVFHYSTGTLNKEIENDVSSIQNMHRFFTDTRDQLRVNQCPRRPSLPKDLCEQQMEYIRKKEKEVDAEIQRLEGIKNNITAIHRTGPRAPLISEKEVTDERIKDANNYSITRKRDVVMSSQDQDVKKGKMCSLFNSSQEELLREKMYSEYVTQMAEREERKQHKVIKITNSLGSVNTISKSMSALDAFDRKVNNRIEKEFISKARERWDKLGIKDPETEDERECTQNIYKEPKVIEHKIKVIESGKEKDVKKLPNHLQEFVQFTAKDKDHSASSSETVMITPTFKARSTSPAIWRPGAPPPVSGSARSPGAPPPPPPPPVWSPGSAGASPQTPRKTFRPVHFEESPPTRRKFENSEQNGFTSGSESESRLRTSQSAPVTGLSTLGGNNVASRLPRAQNPTVTLLQKAREGQLSRGAYYLQQERDAARLPRDRPSPPRGDPVHALRKEYASESEAERSDYERGGARKMADAQRKVEGIGPITKDGMPVALRSEVKDPSRWYKKMYDTIHKNKYDDDYVTIRYKSRRGQPPERVSSNKSQYAYFDPRSGYLSEPEGGLSRLGSSTWSDAYDSDITTGPRRRTASVQEERRFSEASSPYMPSNNKYSTLASARASQEIYKTQPGRIEDYVPGKSSVIDKESKQWWDEVMDIFDGQNISSTTSLPQASPKDKKDLTATILSKSNMARALKESGYESDSTLVFRRREDTDGPLSPAERRAAYRDLQAGGEPPLRGFRSPAPPRQDESEIEYIPITSTLTKIRVHKKTPKVHEVICYPITSIETGNQAKFKRLAPSFLNVDIPNKSHDYPPAPPRRVSSKNSQTLKLVASTRSISTSPKRTMSSPSQSNINFLKNKISNKLSRQNTQIISKPISLSEKCIDKKNIRARIMSTSAPPAINKKSHSLATSKSLYKNVSEESKSVGSSSFGSPRRTILPIEYSNSVHRKYSEAPSSILIEGGAGRKTPITNILDKVTPLDKLWSAEKRNERIDLSKVRAKSLNKENIMNKNTATKISVSSNIKSLSPTITHKSRDMIRTAEKLQKLKISKLHTKSNPCLSSRSEQKFTKTTVPTSVTISKSSSNLSLIPSSRKKEQVKTALVTNLKKKKSNENVVLRPRNPCHETCSKKSKDNSKNNKKKNSKITKKVNSKPSDESETGSQFGDISCDMSNIGSYENLNDKQKHNSKEIKQSHDAIVSDSFFQHLFLGRSHTTTCAYPILEPTTTVLQKARMFQSLPENSISPKSLNTYLIHRKPVSMSRFKIWDRYASPAREKSPRSVSWPGKIHDSIRKFDSLLKCDEFGSSSSIATVRSKSEPPCNKIYFSQTSRPKSPTVLFYKKDQIQTHTPKSTLSPTKIVFTGAKESFKGIKSLQTKHNPISATNMSLTDTVHPTSTVISRSSPHIEKAELKSSNEKFPSTIFFSQTSRPVSPKVTRRSISISRSLSTSPVTIRSPSYRRIHNARAQTNRNIVETVPKNVFRTRSAGDADRKSFQNSFREITKSDTNLHTNDPDYDEYIHDMQNTKVRSERFRELNRYYSYLERVAELERTTSSSDLRHRKKDEEIIDFDRWKKIRAIERAEGELNNLYRKLKLAQIESDVLFYPRDLKDFRWNYDTDRGLRTKEKSVEDLKDHFKQITQYDSLDCDQISSRDTYKPLWRGTSVAETAFYINKKNDYDEIENRAKIKPTVTLQQDTSFNDLRKKIGLGSRLWSSLSMEQVNALKSQLNAIYSKELETKANREADKYVIDVQNTKVDADSSLHVRCNSLITSDFSSDKEKPAKLNKADSIAAISCPITSVKELKNNVNKIQMSLSEIEKRKISQTLSKEVLDKMNKFDNQPSLKEEIETSVTIKSVEENIRIAPKPPNIIAKNNKTVNATDNKLNYLVASNEKAEIPYHSSASETETASSDLSNKTVIYRGPSKEVQKKVEYFESVKKLYGQTNTIYHARENSDENDNQIIPASKTVIAVKETSPVLSDVKPTDAQKNQIMQSHSCTNFRELFGETDKNKFLSLPSKPHQNSRSASPHSEVYVSDRRTPDTLRYSSDETIWRSRSPSPDPERYWRTYLNLARAGEVRRIARRFDAPLVAGTGLRRYRSDPEIARNAFSTFEKHTSRRDKSRVVLPVARVPLRPTNRFMPHIDIISKLAALRRRTAPRSRSAEEALECRPGEVDRIRRRFEAMSLLGQIYASAPDVSELHEIAPYLAGSWVAHRFPKYSDNNRSIENPEILVQGRELPVKKEIKRTKTKESIKLSSILKSDTLAKQEYNPELHRPASRYEPPRAPPRPPPASWPYRLSPYVTPSRHSVTFQETDSAPEPPRRSAYGSYSDTESPRRYVESDVNIHYRVPVRHDPLPLVPERELARQQAEHMKRLYREQKRNKYLQELQDMQNRRHQDNFTPSQKNILPLNRYDEADKVIARALYTFNGQTSRELSFRKGEMIHVRRQIDNNWYEGELHGRIGLFPYNYVEIQKGDVVQTPKKPVIVEGRARAKFDFTAQTNLELPLKKGEIVVLTRRIDQNWWEGRNGAKTGIFPDSYVTVLQEPSPSKPEPHQMLNSDKPMASPAAHGLLNGTAKRSMGAHSYTPQQNSQALSNAPPATQPLPGYVAKPAQATLSAAERGYGPPGGAGVDLNNTEPLYVDTNAEAVPYRAMYKYRPQNPDELELNEGDTVYVLEKCDDGWYVGSSQRTGRFGTFPGNYVERI